MSHPPRSPAARWFLLMCTGLAFAGFVALGSWQLLRLQWKLDLIARVDQRVHAPAVPPPGPQHWPAVNADGDGYRHVRLTGDYLFDKSVQVQAATELGSGYWLLTPLRQGDGTTVLVNRGFIYAPADRPADGTPALNNPVTVTGLLRITEPGGGFLRHNDPASGHWYSRDVAAIAAAEKLDLARTAPYFVDADAAQEPGATAANRGALAHPVGGLTVISFHNSHLVYAVTWYALALMVAGALFWVVRDEKRQVKRIRAE
jgi:surfeit locus 1 family protein